MKEEKETVYDEAIETAKEIEVVENDSDAATQLLFSSQDVWPENPGSQNRLFPGQTSAS